VSKYRLALLALVALFGGAQLIPSERTNPPVSGEIVTPEAVTAILRRCCYDCHSNETEWPWYAGIAPMSWRVASDVTAGRERLNFSEWQSLDEPKRRERLKQIWREVETGRMPIALYGFMHGDSRPAPSELEELHAWAMGTAQDDLGAPGSGG